MSDQSPILSLPYIQAAQAQKHITHNEALRLLDVLVQPTVLAADLDTPPVDGQTGDRYLVPVGATSDWAGRDDHIAVREVSHWTFVAPQKGWQVRVLDTLSTLVFDGTAWTVAASGGASDTLGVNTAADENNRLAVSSPATLLTHEGGGHQLKINKAAPAQTNSLLYQTNWSGRAEMGCSGEDAFAVKVSADGASWNTSLRCDPTTGTVAFPSGAVVPSRQSIMGRWYCETNNRWVGFSDAQGPQNGNFSKNGGTGAEPSENWQQYGLFLEKGAKVTGFEGLFRTLSTAVTGFDFRVFFQYGVPGTNWWGNANTVREELHSTDANYVAAGWTTHADQTLDYVAPQDGSLLMYLRPIGTI
ncbi:MAG: DUF2793 domain-containing protein, partial [Pseudomonadota bacterium]